VNIMRVFRLSSIGLIIAMVSVTAKAERDWVWLYGYDGENFYYSHEGTGEKLFTGGLTGLLLDNPRIWARILYSSPIDYRGNPVNEIIYHYEFDCPGLIKKSADIRRLKGEYYFRGSEVRDFGRGKWQDVVRSSPMSLLMNVACD
jgi:hypothetical protein